MRGRDLLRRERAGARRVSRIRTFVLDRIEGAGDRAVAVLVEDGGEVLEERLRDLPPRLKEGVVLRVHSQNGTLQWSRAVVDDAETQRRREASRAVLDRLRSTDPGGRLVLRWLAEQINRPQQRQRFLPV